MYMSRMQGNVQLRTRVGFPGLLRHLKRKKTLICNNTLLLGSYFGLWHPFTSFSLPNSLPFLDLELKGGVFASIKSGQRHVDGSRCWDKAQQRNNKRHGVFDPGNRIVKRPVRCKEVQPKVSKKRSGKGWRWHNDHGKSKKLQVLLCLIVFWWWKM